MRKICFASTRSARSQKVRVLRNIASNVGQCRLRGDISVRNIISQID